MDQLTNNVLDCALVFEGGGYRASYTAGIANVLLENGIHFDFVCGISAGASHTVDYVSRDQHRVEISFTGGDGSRKAAGIGTFLRGKGYFDADYLYEGAVADGSMPFDFETFQANPAKVAIQAFESETGRTRVFTKDDMPTLGDMMDRVRASSTLPMLMKPLPVDGVTYLDGGLGEGAGNPLHLAEEAGYERFFFVATRPRGYRKDAPTPREQDAITHLGRNRPYLRNALLTRWERYNAALDHLLELEREGRCYVVWPDMMPVKSTTVDRTALRTSYDLGHAQGVRDLPEWRRFLFGEDADGATGARADAGAGA